MCPECPELLFEHLQPCKSCQTSYRSVTVTAEIILKSFMYVCTGFATHGNKRKSRGEGVKGTVVGEGGGRKLLSVGGHQFTPLNCNTSLFKSVPQISAISSLWWKFAIARANIAQFRCALVWSRSIGSVSTTPDHVYTLLPAKKEHVFASIVIQIEGAQRSEHSYF